MQLPKQAIQAGHEAEKDTQWRINRALGSAKNWVIMHNMLIPDPRSSSSCQIDHLFFNRLLQFFVLETKSTRGGCSLNKTNGAWGRFYNGNRQPMASPVEQNKRHIECLEHLLKESKLARWPTIYSWIVVEPGSDVPTKFEGARLIQRDALESRINEEIEKNLTFKQLLSLSSRERIHEIRDYILASKPEASPAAKAPSEPEDPADKLQRKWEERAQQRAEPSPEESFAPKESASLTCEACHIPVADKVVHYCRLKKAELGGRLLCPTCQKKHREEKPITCAKCSTPIDNKVAFYCRLNWQKMGKQYLCRTCQPK